MHKLFLVYFVNLYMFRAYLGPSSGQMTVCCTEDNRQIFKIKGFLSLLYENPVMYLFTF